MSKQPMIFRCRNGMCHNEINPEKNLFCESCRERTSEKDVKNFGMKAEIKDGLCYFEDGRIFDLSQEIDVCDVPISPTKGRETSRND
jgi:hypothetical protein